MTAAISTAIVPVLYLLATVLFIFGIKGLTKVRTARHGNRLAAIAMLVAVVATLLLIGRVNYQWILIGLVAGGLAGGIAAVRVEMTAMPEMVALFNGFGGAASALVASSLLWLTIIQPGEIETAAQAVGGTSAITSSLSILIGALTFSGSLVAYLKLAGKISGQPILMPGRHALNALLVLGSLAIGLWLAYFAVGPEAIEIAAVVLGALALVLGVTLVIPIGGADMPVVISLLNSYSGLAAAATGFVLHNNLLIIAGALVGASGLILTQIMCVAMNRTLSNVLFGGFGAVATTGGGGGSSEYTNVKSSSPEEAAMILESAESVVFVPGYGLAVAQAQHTAKELGEQLEKRGTHVAYAIHPVAGRMPGHMNVLLAEADVDYDKLMEMDAINPDFANTDVVLVVGANDVVNPAAEKDPGSPIYGMPILQVFNARTTIVIKRSLSPGFAGIKNDLFEYPNNIMVYGDAKKVLQEIITELKDL